jgi:RNA 2',3'-cyclic 3'-phosphodiesterase
VRLFVAITPPPAAIGQLDQAVARLRSARPELRWAGTDAWHVTLAFLGEVDERVLPDLRTRLQRAAGRHEAQPLAIMGGGAFPSAGRARVLWAGLQADTAALAGLAASVAAGARRAGAPPADEGRKYRPHLTLARCREPADVRDLVAELAGFTSTGWTASQIELIRSHLGRQPRYEQLASWPLRPAG